MMSDKKPIEALKMIGVKTRNLPLTGASLLVLTLLLTCSVVSFIYLSVSGQHSCQQLQIARAEKIIKDAGTNFESGNWIADDGEITYNQVTRVVYYYGRDGSFAAEDIGKGILIFSSLFDGVCYVVPVGSRNSTSVNSFQNFMRSKGGMVQAVARADNYETLPGKIEDLSMIPEGARRRCENGYQWLLPKGPNSASRCIMERSFRVLKNIAVKEGIYGNPNSKTLWNVADDFACHSHCMAAYGSDCNIFSYDTTRKKCMVSSADFYSTWTLSEPANGTVSFFRHQSNKWKTVYRRPKHTKSGYTNEVTGPWFNDSYYDGVLPITESTEPDGSSWRVLKSQLVTVWDQLDIHQVKVSLYKNGREMKYLIFKGKDSSSHSWFDYSMLKRTSWRDLDNSAPMYLGWWWHLGKDLITGRSMYIPAIHAGCDNDSIWMVFFQNKLYEPCSLFKAIPAEEIPKFLYSPLDTYAYQTSLEEADYMVISVSFQ